MVNECGSEVRFDFKYRWMMDGEGELSTIEYRDGEREICNKINYKWRYRLNCEIEIMVRWMVEIDWMSRWSVDC